MTNITKKRTFAYKQMAKYAADNDDLHDYTLLHYATWFACAILMLPVMALAIHCDFSVLYGMYYNVSRDENSSMFIAGGGAAIIAAIILFPGKMFIKLSINGKHPFRLKKRMDNLIRAGKKTDAVLLKENAIQWGIHLTLLSLGLFATGFLSFNADQRTKADAYKTEMRIEQKTKAHTDSLVSSMNNELQQLYEAYRRDSITIAEQHDALIGAAGAAWKKSLEGYNQKLKQKTITKEKFEGSTRYLEYLVERDEAPKRTEKAAALLELSNQYTAARNDLKQRYTKEIQQKPERTSEEIKELEQNLAVAALSTKGFNIMLNLLSVLLTAGMLFFARGANVDSNSGNDDDDDFIYIPDTNIPDPIPDPIPTPLKDPIPDNSLENEPEDNGQQSILSVNNSNYNKENTDENDDKQYVQVVEHNGKMYNRNQVLQFMKTYRERAVKYTQEGKLDLVPHNRSMGEYWQKKLEEFDNQKVG